MLLSLAVYASCAAHMPKHQQMWVDTSCIPYFDPSETAIDVQASRLVYVSNYATLHHSHYDKNVVLESFD